MEVLFVSHKYPPSTGGMQKQSYELINGMQQYTVVHKIVHEGDSSILNFFITVKKRIMAAIRANPGISVIHFNDGLMAAVCINHKGYEHIKRVVTVHGLDVTFPLAIYQKKILPKFARFDLIIPVSHATRDVCVAKGLPAQKLAVIHNGVDTEIKNIPPDPAFIKKLKSTYGIDLAGKKLLVSLGRPVKRKGFSWFVENVLPRLDDRFLYVMAGPFDTKTGVAGILRKFLPPALRHHVDLFLGFASDTTSLKKILNHEKWKGRVMHVGKLPFIDLVQLLKVADVFVMPNLHVEGDMEGFGLVCLEACICGAPVIAANIDGIPDAIADIRNGYLVDAGNSVAWAEKISEVSRQDPATRSGHTASFIQYTCDHYQWQQMVSAYYNAFTNL